MALQNSGCPLWSPNGRWIAVCNSKSREVTSIDLVSPSGAAQQHILTRDNIAPVAWSPTSDAILFRRVKDVTKFGDSQLFIVSIRSHRVIPVPGTSGAGTASWHR